jgi:hypothetical protein
MNLRKVIFWSLLALCVTGTVELPAQPQETVRDFLSKCERGKGDDACPNQVGGWLAIEDFANGPFCSGVPPKRFNELSKSEVKALASFVHRPMAPRASSDTRYGRGRRNGDGSQGAVSVPPMKFLSFLRRARVGASNPKTALAGC